MLDVELGSDGWALQMQSCGKVILARQYGQKALNVLHVSAFHPATARLRGIVSSDNR